MPVMHDGGVDSLGNLDVVVSETGMLRIEGWVASLDAGVVEDLRVQCSGKVLTPGEVVTHLPSPDVETVHPALVAAGRCRFRLRVPLSGGDEERAAVVAVTPVFGGRNGRMMVCVPQPALPMPSAEDAGCIGGAFMAVGCEFLGHFIQLAGLQTNEHVLDVGCGVGRMAFALAHYLDAAARYEGFDIVDRLIRWCQEMITPRFANFRFRHVAVRNQLYNPGGTLSPDGFAFPYEDSAFTFVFLTSIFTHMRPPELRHYLDEIHRVLRPGGRCLCTLFLLNDESERQISAGKSSQNLVHPLGECFTACAELPESAIGFPEASVLRWVAERRLNVVAQYDGSWCGRARSTSYQDMLILRK